MFQKRNIAYLHRNRNLRDHNPHTASCLLSWVVDRQIPTEVRPLQQPEIQTGSSLTYPYFSIVDCLYIDI